MANEQNLRPGEYKFTDEDREKAKRSRQENLKKTAELRAHAAAWLEAEVGKDKHGNSLTGAEAMIQLAAKEALKGNAKFWELLRDTAGQKPVEKVMIADVDQSVIDEVEAMVNDPSTGG
jgi:hypothetical protein